MDIHNLYLERFDAGGRVQREDGWAAVCTREETVDHNMVAADTDGRIGSLVRAMVPCRPRANRWLPLLGWAQHGAWQGWIPFEHMPRSIDPPGGVIVTANNRVEADGDDYLCTDCHPPYRAQRITALIDERPAFSVADAASLHADVLSPNAALFQARLAALPAPDGEAGAIRQILLAWDGRMAADSVAATQYNALRRAATAILARRSGLTRATWVIRERTSSIRAASVEEGVASPSARLLVCR